MATQSLSSDWRKKGNSIYVTATNNFSPVVRKDRLSKAISCYLSALSCSNGNDETASAAKNLAMAFWRFAMILLAAGHIQEAIRSFLDSFKNFGKSLETSKCCKPQIWKDDLIASLHRCYEDFDPVLENVELKHRMQVMRDVIDHICTNDISAHCFLRLAKYHFHHGIICLGEGDYTTCLFEMRECYFPIQEAGRLGGMMDDITSEVCVLEQDVFMHQCTAESIQARLTGDDLLKHVMQDEENINVDMVWEVIDWYKKSVLMTREVTEVEQEAISLARIGKVYSKVLKMKDKAKDYLKQAIELALSMHPRTFNDNEWYKECAQTLERYQQEFLREEEKKVSEERDSVLKELEKEMAALEAHKDDFDVIFLKFIYKEFPPKNKLHKLATIPEVLEQDERKKLLQQAIVHYHPDRAKVEDGENWKIFSEEITKRITKRYECLK